MTSSSLAAWESRMKTLAAQYQTAPADVVAASARAYTTSIRRSISSVTSGGKLRGVGTKGARVGVKYTLLGSAANPHAYVQATGPLQLLERDTKAHQEPKTKGSRRLRTASGRLSHKRQQTNRNLNAARFIGNESRGFAAIGPVTHPGTRGKHPFERGVLAAESAALIDAVTQLRRSIAGVFK